MLDGCMPADKYDWAGGEAFDAAWHGQNRRLFLSSRTFLQMESGADETASTARANLCDDGGWHPVFDPAGKYFGRLRGARTGHPVARQANALLDRSRRLLRVKMLSQGPERLGKQADPAPALHAAEAPAPWPNLGACTVLRSDRPQSSPARRLIQSVAPI
jgi:hypothetical protein